MSLEGNGTAILFYKGNKAAGGWDHAPGDVLWLCHNTEVGTTLACHASAKAKTMDEVTAGDPIFFNEGGALEDGQHDWSSFNSDTHGWDRLGAFMTVTE